MALRSRVPAGSMRTTARRPPGEGDVAYRAGQVILAQESYPSKFEKLDASGFLSRSLDMQ